MRQSCRRRPRGIRLSRSPPHQTAARLLSRLVRPGLPYVPGDSCNASLCFVRAGCHLLLEHFGMRVSREHRVESDAVLCRIERGGPVTLRLLAGRYTASPVPLVQPSTRMILPSGMISRPASQAAPGSVRDVRAPRSSAHRAPAHRPRRVLCRSCGAMQPVAGLRRLYRWPGSCNPGADRDCDRPRR